MNVEYKDFIGYYRDVYPEGFCEHMIKEFDRLQLNGVGSNRQKAEGVSRHVKEDYHIFLNFKNHTVEDFNGQESTELFFNGLQRCYDDYTDLYSTLKNHSIHSTSIKCQKTGPGGGYHLWHCEQGEGSASNRVLVYMLYLNDIISEPNVESGGETEFLYQKTRIKPEKNLMLLWPASYTHTHRGNPVLVDQYKYVITGWFYLN